MRMKLGEFIKTYCSDLAEVKKPKYAIEGFDVSYDELVETEDGELIQVIWDNGNSIDVQDIFLLSENDFENKYPGSVQAYKNYRGNFIILNGAEVFLYYKQLVEDARKEIESYKSIGLGKGEWI